MLAHLVSNGYSRTLTIPPSPNISYTTQFHLRSSLRRNHTGSFPLYASSSDLEYRKGRDIRQILILPALTLRGQG